jgi:hypothetical protein
MQLSRELFKQIIAQLKGGKDLNHHNKRREPRVGLRNRVALTALKGPNNTPEPSAIVNVRDLSRDGIGFLHHSRIPSNTLFTIRLPALEDGDLLALYKVRHCQLLEEGLYRVGAELVNICEANESPVPAGVTVGAAAPAPKEAAPPAKAAATPAAVPPQAVPTQAVPAAAADAA